MCCVSAACYLILIDVLSSSGEQGSLAACRHLHWPDACPTDTRTDLAALRKQAKDEARASLIAIDTYADQLEVVRLTFKPS